MIGHIICKEDNVKITQLWNEYRSGKIVSQVNVKRNKNLHYLYTICYGDGDGDGVK